MSHTSQRRGLEKFRSGREILVLAMVPAGFEKKPGIDTAMEELAAAILKHGPDNWVSRNFTELAIPEMGIARRPLEWMIERWPHATRELLMRIVAGRSPILTAVYNEPARVIALIRDLKGGWLEKNRERGYPISMVLSGLAGDVHRCCSKTEQREHTYLQSMGFFGRVEHLPSGEELSLMTMCGHGLISVRLVRRLLAKIRGGGITAAEAAHEIAQPCVCGIVNRKRAEEIFQRLA